MRIPDEMAALIRAQFPEFEKRAIARELLDLLLTSDRPGEIAFTPMTMATEWMVSSDAIWEVVGSLGSKGMLEVDQGAVSDLLICPPMRSSAPAVKKKAKRSDLATLKARAIESRAADLKLKDAAPGAISEIVRRIPLEERNERLLRGYHGWLPTALYGLDGVIFILLPEFCTALEEEYPGVDLQAAFEMMFDDLRSERHCRPNVPNMPYWIRQWIMKHGSSMVRYSEGEKLADEPMIVEAEY